MSVYFLFLLLFFFISDLHYPSALALTRNTKLVQTEKLSFMSFTGNLHITPQGRGDNSVAMVSFLYCHLFRCWPIDLKVSTQKHWFFPRCWWEISRGWGVSLVLDHIITTNGDTDIYIHTHRSEHVPSDIWFIPKCWWKISCSGSVVTELDRNTATNWRSIIMTYSKIHVPGQYLTSLPHMLWTNHNSLALS